MTFYQIGWIPSIFHLDLWLFADFLVFTHYYLFLPIANLKLFCFDFQNNFRFATGKNRYIRTGKNTEVNKQSHVIFWRNWRKYGSVSYPFSCKITPNFCSLLRKPKKSSVQSESLAHKCSKLKSSTIWIFRWYAFMLSVVMA